MSVKVEFRQDRQKWQVTYYLEGKRKRPLFGEERKARDFARLIELGLAPEPEDTITIASGSREYYDRVSTKKNPKSRSNDKRYLNLHEHFMFTERGIERLGTVTLSDVESFRDWLITGPLYLEERVQMGPATVNRCCRVLKHFYRKHVQWKNIGESPCLYLDMLDSVSRERKAMSAEQYLATLEACSGWLRDAVEFTFLTGAPPSCLARMEWSDVDLFARKYFVIRKKGSKALSRRIPMGMGESTFFLLSRLQRKSGGEGHVFKDEAGRKLLADRISRAANEAIREAGIEGVTFYGLRHALATDMTAAGIATEVVRQAMGHQSISTTQLYANKVKLQIVTDALESVRGGSLVANGD